jgi:hypothetical protein
MPSREQLQKATWATQMLEQTFLRDLDEDVSVEDLADLFDNTVEWLATHPQWRLPEALQKKWKFNDAIAELQSSEGGKFLNFRVLRAQERLHRNPRQEGDEEFLAVRYVIADGTRDMAEVVVDYETNEIEWVMVYQSQNLVHLVQGATKHNVRIVD